MLRCFRRKPEVLLWPWHCRSCAKTLTFCNISVVTEDIYLKLGVCVHYPKSNLYYQGRQFKMYLYRIMPLFSSSEHNMLRGSYCDRSSSGVRLSIRPSVNNFFKNLLLQNQKANLDKTWQECSLGEALQKLLKEFNSNKNSGCHGNKMAENGKNL